MAIEKINSLIKFFKKNIKLFQIFIVVLCFYIIFKKLDNESILSFILNISFFDFLFIFLIKSIFIFIYLILIYKIIIITTVSKVDFSKWSLIFINSQFLNILPYFGFVYRAIKLKKYGISYERYIGIYYLIIWLFFILNLFIYCLEVYFIIPNKIIIYNINIIAVLFFAAILASLAPYVIKKIFSKIPNYNSIIKFILEKSQNILNYASNSLKSKKFVTNFIFYGLLAHIFEFLIIYSVILAMDMPLKIHHILIFFIINHLIDTFQFTPSNIGISELIMAAVGNQIGLDFSIGITIKLLIRGIHLFTIVLLTALINIIYKFTKGNFKV